VRGFSFLVARQHKGNLKSGYGFQAAPSFATIQSVFTTQFWKLANIVTLPMAGRSKEAKA